MPGLKERAKTLVELADGASFLFAERPLVVDEKAAALLDADRDKDILTRRPQGAVRRSSDWNAANAEAAIREYAERQQPEARRGRAAVARRVDGKAAPLPVFSTCWRCLGRDESLARIGDQID